MKCPHCPVSAAPCLGEGVARLCTLAETRPDYRLLLIERARVFPPNASDSFLASRRVLANVAACPQRGRILPHTLQPECGCAELTECLAGRGHHPGRVTVRDCVACVSRDSAITAFNSDQSSRAQS